MLLIFFASLILITVACAGFQLAIRLNTLNANPACLSDALSGSHRSRSYKPMARLLSAEDLEVASASPQLRRELRKQRRQIYRAYIRCLSRDYARLLGGVRWIMVNSNVDRPDLAALLAKQRREFAIAMCRIEWMLALHALGLENVSVDVSGMVSAVDNLTGIVNVFSAARA